MSTRVAVALVALVLAAAALWHPAPRPVLQAISAPSPAWQPAAARRRTGEFRTPPEGAVVYVAGAVRKPGLYRLRPGDRVADAIGRAGGTLVPAGSGSVNLAARTADGDEIYVPEPGEPAPRAPGCAGNRRRSVRSHRSAAAPADLGSVDLNAADTPTLARVPGIGRAIAARIVEMRRLDGAFASSDELLDVAGMTQARLDRARPFLRQQP